MKHVALPRNHHVPVEAVTICINYSDHLKYCLTNRFYLDRWVIVTVEDDLETIRLCETHSIEYLLSKRIFEAGAEFSKGKAINEGIARLSKAGWIVVLDSDIVLPFDFRHVVDAVQLSKQNLRSIFGPCGRRLIAISESYRSTSKYSLLTQAHNFYKNKFKEVKRDKKSNFQHLELMRRKIETKFFKDWEVQTLKQQWKLFSTRHWHKLLFAFEDIESDHLGYFQMFHSQNFKWYPELSKTSAGDDIKFSKSFPARYRKSLSMDCVHVGPPGPGVVKLLGNLGYVEKLDEHVRGKKSSIRIRPSKYRLESRQILTGAFWSVWGQHILDCERKIMSARGTFRFYFSFQSSDSPIWFFSLNTTEPVSLSDEKHLCFDLKVSRRCNLEFGYGRPEKNKSSWFQLNLENMLANDWQTIRLPLQPKNEMNKGFNSIAIRGSNPNCKSKISISEPYLEK